VPITPLLSAARLALPRLRSLVGPAEPEIRRRLESLLQRARSGEDVDEELLEVVASETALRRFIAGLVRDKTTYRSASRGAAEQPHMGGIASTTRPSAATGEAELSGDTRESERHVNAFVTAAGSETAWQTALVPAAAYEVLVHIGAALQQSLLDPVDTQMCLPMPLGEGTWLRAVLDLDDAKGLVVAPLYVAANGESFSCGCDYGSAHRDSCVQSLWTRLPFLAPLGRTSCTTVLIIYHDAVALHVQAVTLPIGEALGGPTARLVSRMTKTFTDLDDLAGRSASVVLSEGTSRLTVNGLGFTAAPFSVTPGAADTVTLNMRQVLYDIHIRSDGERELNRYDDDLRKPRDAFIIDLGRLARYGSALYTRLFDPQNPDQTTRYSLPALLRHEALLRGKPPLVQVTDRDYTDHSVLWQAIYDLPLGSDPHAYQACPSLSELDTLVAASSAPALCPYDESHRGELNILCPWGFWGLSTYLEQPEDRPTGPIQARLSPMTCFAVAGPGLEPLQARHLQRLHQSLGGGSIRTCTASSAADLAVDLAEDNVDVVYFYCHCGYEEGALGTGVDRYLQLQNYSIMAQDVISWAQSRIWPRDHWKRRPPLILLNGCHTAEYTARTLNSFVPAFIRWGNACGVVGTEITVHQTIADWIGESLLAKLWAGDAIARAMRDIRWQLLARGNVIGLGYTPYCLGDLRFSSNRIGVS
jgi:hypothetical protein